MADLDGDAGHFDFSGAAWEGFVCAADADGLDGDAGFDCDEADSGCSRADFSVEGAGTLGEDEDAPAFAQFTDDGFQGCHVGSILIDGDGVPLWVDPFCRAFEECFACEEDHFILVEVPDEWGV